MVFPGSQFFFAAQSSYPSASLYIRQQASVDDFDDDVVGKWDENV
jgi:hypothetical protein